jgi:hypothetical protein
MFPGGKIITVLAVVLVAMGPGYADMVPICDIDTAGQPTARMEGWTNPPGGDYRCLSAGYGIAGLEWEAEVIVHAHRALPARPPPGCREESL